MPNFRSFLSRILNKMPRDILFYKIHWVKMGQKRGKSTDWNLKFWRWSAYISMQNIRLAKIESVLNMESIHHNDKFRSFLSYYVRRYRQTGTDGAKMFPVGRMDQQPHVRVERLYFELRTDERLDVQPEMIMPPVPRGGGIQVACFIRCSIRKLEPE